MTLSAGEALLISGANGAGKTSLMRGLCGLVRPETGRISWNGAPIDDLGEDYRAVLRFLGHLPGCKAELSCDENLAHSLACEGIRADAASRRRALALVGLDGHAAVPARGLSQGQTRRLALARLHFCRRPLWLMDEPFNALDAQARDWLETRLFEHLDDGGMLVLTSHQPFRQPASLRRLHIGD